MLESATGTVVAVGHQQQRRDPGSRCRFVTIPAAGSYFVAIQVVSGPAPGHVEFVDFNDTNELIASASSSAAPAARTIPSSFGHATAANTIGVGATPWWAPAPFLGQNPLANEPFSSDGPGLYTSSTPTARR